MAQRLTAKERERRARNRANARASTGPRTAAGKARASRNAITHGLAARGPVDEAEVADRDRRAAALALEIAPEGPVEAALVDRLAAAFQRLETADPLEARLFDGAFRPGDVPPGMRRYRRTDGRRRPAVPGRYRATAAGGTIRTRHRLEGRREARRRAAEARFGNRSQRAGFVSGDKGLGGDFGGRGGAGQRASRA